MENNDIQLIGGPCGQHGPYTFYKAFKYTKNGVKRIVTLSEFFFVKLWIDSDLLCIGELQLLWIDKNSEQVLASLRLYFLPENTPEGRMDHGEDEVLAISEKVVLRVEDLVTWITVDAEWSWGILAKTDSEVEKPKNIEDAYVATGLLAESSLDFLDVEKERDLLDDFEQNGPSVVILSYPRYCRYRSMMKRLEGVENEFLKFKIVNALGGFTVTAKNTRVLFCRDTFDYPDLEGHELLCNHLAPKLKGRPRGKRKKRSVSPGSESNESESSITNAFTATTKIIDCEPSTSTGRRSTRLIENSESKEFLKKLHAFMKSNRTPMGRVPSLGYKEIDLHGFYTKVQKLGGYDAVTTNRLWKSIFDEMSGHQNSTSAATVIRRHYERFLLPYERHMKGEEYKPLPVSERRRLKSKAGSSISDAENSEGTSRSGNTTPVPTAPITVTTPTENKEFNIQVKAEVKTSSLRSVRVKPDRQKDKQVNSEKCNVQNINISITTTTTMEKASKSPEMPSVTIEKTNVSVEKSPVNSEPPEDIKLEIIPITESLQTIKNEDVIKTEISMKTEIIPIKIENIPDKNAEPLTSAVAPVAQKVSPDKTLSPVEGKESIPIIKTGDTASTNGKNNEFTEVPYKPKSPDIESNSERYKSINSNLLSIIHEVKKRKLDILKEGGLEVTPVRSSPVPISKDNRPSVIQQNLPIPHISAKIVPSDVQSMPPPSINKLSSRRLSVNLPQNLDISPSIQNTKTTNKETTTSPPSHNNIHSNMNGYFPPKVLQSRSIYSYSEKTVYGNPRETLNPPAAHTPKVPSSYTRSTGGDILDLTVTSPQKPVVEIMRVPNISASNYYQTTNNHKTSTQSKHMYKEPHLKSTYRSSAPYIDGRRLGSNLEITLVGPTSKQPNISSKSSLPSSSPINIHSNHSRHSHKRLSNDSLITNKVPRIEESSKYIKNSNSNYSVPHHRESKNNLELSIPNPYRNSNMKSESSVSYSKQSLPNPTSGYNNKHFQSLNNTAQLSPYLAQFPSYAPLLNPLYYSAMQNCVQPMMPFNPEQLKLYTELLMSRDSRLPFHFPLPQDGSPSMLNNNNFKKP